MKRIISFLFIGCFLLLSQSCLATLQTINDLSSSSGRDTAGYYIQLTWTATANNASADTGATFYYYIYANPGIYGSASNTTSYVYYVGLTSTPSFQWHQSLVQDYTFIVYAQEVGGLNIGDSIYSNTTTNPFLYGAVISPVGQTQKNIYYYIKDTAYVNLYVYSLLAINYDTFGYPVHDATYNNYVRRIVNHVSTGYLSINQAEWNCRDDAGNLVANGTYYVFIEALQDTIGLGSWWGSTDVNITASGSFEASVSCYPNPAKNSPITFSYFLAAVPANITIEVFTITGELVYNTTFTDIGPAGTRTSPWTCMNNSGNTIGSDIYIYRITSRVGSTETRSTKKLVYIK